MDWDRLRIFHTVAELGSLTGAGRSLSLSQSAVSRQIASLEEELGTALFRRHARGLVLTEQGLILQKTTKEIASSLLRTREKLMDAHRKPVGPLTITVSEFTASTWLASRLTEFREEYPEIQLTVLIDDRVLNLNLREADAAIRLYKPKESGLVQRHLGSIGFQICGAKQYFKRHGYPEKAEDLKNHFLLGYPEGLPGPFSNHNWLFDMADINVQEHGNVLLMNSMYAIFRAAVAGAGLAVLPDYLIRTEKELEPILPKLKRPDVDMYFIYAEERRNSKRINALRDFILKNTLKSEF